MVSPIPVLIILVSTLTFMGLLFGAELADTSFPAYESPDTGGFWGALEAIVAVVKVIWGAVVFFFNLITFNVPGAPWYVRVPLAAAFGGALVWAIAGLIRGGK